MEFKFVLINTLTHNQGLVHLREKGDTFKFVLFSTSKQPIQCVNSPRMSPFLVTQNTFLKIVNG